MKIISLSSNDCGGFQPPKGHLDTQMFPECAGTECDRDIVKKTEEKRKNDKKKKKKASGDNIVLEAKLADNWENIEKFGLVDKQLVDVFIGFAEKTGGTYEGLYKGKASNYTPQINLLNKAILLAMPISDTSNGSEIQASPKDITKAAEYIKIALNGIDNVDEAFLIASEGDKMKITKKSMTNRDQLIQQINASPKDFILKAIKNMGEEVVAGFSGVTLADLDDIVNLCDDYELKEIINGISNMKSEVQPELNLASKKVGAQARIVTANGKQTIKISKSEWESIGKKAGWMKEAKKKSPMEHGFIDQCIKENKDKGDPGAYCASIVDKAKGTTDWRKGTKKSSDTKGKDAGDA